jgi:transcriptional regulator with XRE-family HTH domain
VQANKQNGNRGNLERARRAIGALDLSLRQVARTCGVSPAHLHLFFAGDRKGSPELANRLRTTLGASAWNFIIGLTDTLVIEARR